MKLTKNSAKTHHSNREQFSFEIAWYIPRLIMPLMSTILPASVAVKIFFKKSSTLTPSLTVGSRFLSSTIVLGAWQTYQSFFRKILV